MTDTEKQLRDILKDRDADSEHLLDEVLNERREDDLVTILEVRRRADRYQRSLSALREAVKFTTAWLDGRAEWVKHSSHMDGLGMGWQELENALTGQADSLRALLSAHDAAPAAPTLTLEEVAAKWDEEMREDQEPLRPAHFSRWLRALAQNGAGRGG